MYCIKCGIKNEGRNNYCINCGTRLSEQSSRDIPPNSDIYHNDNILKCSHCGNVTTPEMKYCTKCGLPTLHNHKINKPVLDIRPTEYVKAKEETSKIIEAKTDNSVMDSKGASNKSSATFDTESQSEFPIPGGNVDKEKKEISTQEEPKSLNNTSNDHSTKIIRHNKILKYVSIALAIILIILLLIFYHVTEKRFYDVTENGEELKATEDSNPSQQERESSSQENIKIISFIESFISTSNSRSAEKLSEFYADEVNYYKYPSANKEMIISDKQNFFAKWDVLHYSLNRWNIGIRQLGNIKEISYYVTFTAFNSETNKRSEGTAVFILKLESNGDSFLIIDEKSSVLSNYSNQSNN